MAGILLLMAAEYSGTNASLAFARSLQAAGHRVAYIVRAQWVAYLAANGFDTILIGEREPAAGTRDSGLLPDALEREHEQLHALITTWRPDLLLLDPMLIAAAPPFVERGIPILHLNETFSVPLGWRRLPVTSGYRPSGLSTDTVAIAWEAWKAFTDVYLASGAAARRRRAAVAALRRLGAPVDFGDLGYRLRVPELLVSPAELDFPSVRVPMERIYLGTCVHIDRPSIHFSWDRIPPARRLAYCSLGTLAQGFEPAYRFFREVIAAFDGDPEWTLILQTADTRIHELQSVSDNVIVSKRVPQLEVLARASVFLTHGGASSVREAIYFGVPMIVFPCWRDQHGMAARIEFHRIGGRGDVRNVDRRGVRALLSRATDSDVSSRMSTMSVRCRPQRELAAGVAFVSRFLPST